MATKTQFDAAVKRLLGEEKYNALRSSGYNRPNFCREVAQDAFVRALKGQDTRDADLVLVRQVADRLWQGDGCTGLDD